MTDDITFMNDLIKSTRAGMIHLKTETTLTKH
jgi:hypothetical protein